MTTTEEMIEGNYRNQVKNHQNHTPISSSLSCEETTSVSTVSACHLESLFFREKPEWHIANSGRFVGK